MKYKPTSDVPKAPIDYVPEHKRGRNQFNKPQVEPGMKACCRCERVQPISEFTKNKATSDGLDRRCKTCKKEIHADPVYREQQKARKKAWQENPENLAREKAAKARWDEAHRHDEKRKEWIETNRLALREIKKRYKIRRKGWEAGGKVSYDAILLEYGMICHICGDDIESADDLHFDHLIPLSKGGKHENDNIRPSHSVCNLRKSNKLLNS